jgi:hypothetical protein
MIDLIFQAAFKNQPKTTNFNQRVLLIPSKANGRCHTTSTLTEHKPKGLAIPEQVDGQGLYRLMRRLRGSRLGLFAGGFLLFSFSRGSLDIHHLFG